MKLSDLISNENQKTNTETRSSNARQKTKRSAAWYEDFVGVIHSGNLVKYIPRGICLRERGMTEKNGGKKLIGKCMSLVSGSTIINCRFGKFERIELSGVSKSSMCLLVNVLHESTKTWVQQNLRI